MSGFALIKIFLSATLISFASWLSVKKPILAGFIVALPLTSILAILFSYWHNQDYQQVQVFAKSILIAVPLSLLFFIPFLLPIKWNHSFLLSFISGIGFIFIGYLIHRYFFTS